MITYDEAQHQIRTLFKQVHEETEVIPLLDSVGRIIAEDVTADTDLPLFHQSAVDGYAIIYTPERTAWKLIGSIPAGNYADVHVSDDTAVRIMTGGKLPANATCVIPNEDVDLRDTDVTKHNGIVLREGLNIRKKGEDAVRHSLMVASHTRIRPKTIALLATCGKSSVRVYKKLNIGLLSTGDELIHIDDIPSGDKIRASNLCMLVACTTNSYSHGINFGITPDDPDILRSRLSEMLSDERLDILITCGGISVGEHDYVQGVLKQLGAEILFWKVNIKPGKPLLVAEYRKRKKPVLIFCLPGNPVSSFVTYMLFVQSQIQSLFHQEGYITRKAIAADPLTKSDGKRHFLQGIVEYDPIKGEYLVHRLPSQSSGNMASLNRANCFIVLVEECRSVPKGAMVECIMI